MKKSVSFSLILFSTFLFTFLFFKQALGLNLIIYEAAVIGWLAFTKQFKLSGTNSILTFSAVVVTAFFTLLHHSDLSYTVHFIVFFIFIGVIIAPEVKSLVNSLGLAFSNLFMSWGEYKIEEADPSPKTRKTRYAIWRLRYFLIPLAIILLFSSIYSWANPEFGKIIDHITSVFSDFFSFIFERLDITIFPMIILGGIISTFIFLRAKNKQITEKDAASEDVKRRVHQGGKKHMRILALLNEYRAAVFLFGSLNILLLGLNIMDIDHVWLNFEWKGQYLKQFVHQGTYVLIGAILLSILLVLYFFRGNLNFYKKNKLLKILSYIWLGQNIILAVSVGFRNWYYIQYYALAYKRIAVVFFLLLSVYGLYSVFRKVKGTQSVYYLIRTNANAWLIVLVISSAFNWDRIIARYNFEHADKSFVHLNFLVRLSPTALPELDRPLSELKAIDKQQAGTFFLSMDKLFSLSRYRKIYLGPEKYKEIIDIRKELFMRKWENKSILEWNYAEYKTYEELKALEKQKPT